ncbi:hypothetical protein VN12_14310 [Pirellula sp. SH-Sr6A]|nr:hypothetical protein VN12_14310 [Pirellula sp. SH-Sr6A]
MTKMEILEQVRIANEKIQHWPEWERNILEHSLQPTNKVARSPVDNRAARSPFVLNSKPTDSSQINSDCQS